jgi:DNA-binding PadR family transcriptional regulator
VSTPHLEDPPDLRDAVRLREQAEALQSNADRLAETRMELLKESWALQRDAERIEAAAKRVRSPKRRTYSDDNAEALAKVPDLLRGTGPLGMADISDHLAWTPTRTRAALNRLESVGAIVRTGVKRGTRYQVPEDAPEEHSNVREFGNYGIVVRDAAVKLGTFDFVDMQTALPDVSEATLRKWLGHFEDKGIFESERVGQRKVYAYVEPEGGSAARERKATPEALAATLKVPHHGAAVAGTGRGMGNTRKDVADLLEAATRAGATIEKGGSHWKVRKDGEVIGTVPSTPSDHRSLLNARAALKRKGLAL